MLETADWLAAYFNQAPNAIMIFKDGDLVLSNRLAEQLTQEFNLSTDYLFQIADNVWQQGQNNDCATCIIKRKMGRVDTPLALQSGDGDDHPTSLSLTYQPLDRDRQVFALTIENRDQQERMSTVERQRLLTRYVNRAHEKERQRISQDLHDSIAQGVYSAIMGVRRISEEKLNQEQLSQVCSAIEMQLQETLGEVKGMALDIRPSVLDSFGLIPAIKALAKRLQANSGVTINVLAAAKTDDLSTEVQNILYRISQEAVNNALKHANPSEINIIITSHPHFIQLEVLDDGKGFDVQKQTGFNGHSLGLLNMNERVESLYGSFKIDSAPRQGTTVTVKFPYNNLNKESVKHNV